MRDFDVNNLNEQEFESMLQSTMAELPPDGIAYHVTPWRKAINRILTGFALCAITLNFFALDYLLPAIGMFLCLLGFRTLRKENGWFRTCWCITVIRCTYYFPLLILNTTIYQSTFYASSFYSILNTVNIILIFVLYICFWKALRAVKQKAGLEPYAGGAIGLVIWSAIICVLVFLGITNSLLIGIVLLIAYLCIIRNLVKISKELDEAGYCICVAPVKVTDRAVVLALASAILAGCACGYLFFNQYPMQWQAVSDSETTEVQEIKEHLVSLGIPKHILDDLTETDLLGCKNAIRAVVMVNDFPVNDGRRVQERRADGVIHMYTVYDQKELRITGIAVELPGELEQWKIFHHFQWVIDPGFHGTELIHLWPTHRHPNGWQLSSGFSGQVLYNKGEQVYTAPYIFLADNVYDPDTPSSNEYEDTDVFAEFSMPRNGENKRGYVSYTVTEGAFETIMYSCINYTHQKTWLQYPVITAKEKHMISNIFDTFTFETLQDALQFFPDELEMEQQKVIEND